MLVERSINIQREVDDTRGPNCHLPSTFYGTREDNPDQEVLAIFFVRNTDRFNFLDRFIIESQKRYYYLIGQTPKQTALSDK